MEECRGGSPSPFLFLLTSHFSRSLTTRPTACSRATLLGAKVKAKESGEDYSLTTKRRGVELRICILNADTIFINRRERSRKTIEVTFTGGRRDTQ